LATTVTGSGPDKTARYREQLRQFGTPAQATDPDAPIFFPNTAPRLAQFTPQIEQYVPDSFRCISY
jgi:hypothetical protein